MKILCVDDEPLALQMLELSVKKAKPDAEVLSYRKPRELLEAARQNGCDIAFLDIHMRGMNGVELAKELKAVNPKMNIIFVTGFSDYTGDAMSLHASGYIMKPVNKEKVERELSDLRFPIEPKSNALLRVQCFGNFDVFLACTTKEIAAVLFEDEPYDKKQQNYVQQLIASMMKSLKAAGVEATVSKGFNSLAVNPDTLDCDYYRFKELDAGAVNAYQNEYMSQYYWADFLYDNYSDY